MSLEARMAALTRPFDIEDISFAPKRTFSYNGEDLAGCFAYVDVPAIIKRFNETLGMNNWQSNHEFLPLQMFETQRTNWNNGVKEVTPQQNILVVCNTSIHVRDGETWVSHMGTGTSGNVFDSGSQADPFKSADTDAFKRAAREFGVGLEVWSFPELVLPYDKKKKKITATKDQIRAMLAKHGINVPSRSGATRTEPTPDVHEASPVTHDEEVVGADDVGIDDLNALIN